MKGDVQVLCKMWRLCLCQLLIVQLGEGVGGTSRHNCRVSYLLCSRRRVSATVGHLQVTKMYIEGNYTVCDRDIGAYCKLSTRSRCWLDCTY